MNMEILKPIVASAIRHLLTYAGLTELLGDGDKVAGALIVLAGFGWSVWQKLKTQRRMADAQGN